MPFVSAATGGLFARAFACLATSTISSTFLREYRPGSLRGARGAGRAARRAREGAAVKLGRSATRARSGGQRAPVGPLDDILSVLELGDATVLLAGSVDLADLRAEQRVRGHF